MKGWYGVDLDGTLAEYNGWVNAEHIGNPIPVMVERVTKWLEEGRDVRIVTARVYAPPDDAQRQADAAVSVLIIQDWCKMHLGKALPITCTKDFGMIELWDDRCVQVVPNTGMSLEEFREAIKSKLRPEDAEREAKEP